MRTCLVWDTALIGESDTHAHLQKYFELYLCVHGFIELTPHAWIKPYWRDLSYSSPRTLVKERRWSKTSVVSSGPAPGLPVTSIVLRDTAVEPPSMSLVS